MRNRNPLEIDTRIKMTETITSTARQGKVITTGIKTPHDITIRVTGTPALSQVTLRSTPMVGMTANSTPTPRTLTPGKLISSIRM